MDDIGHHPRQTNFPRCVVRYLITAIQRWLYWKEKVPSLKVSQYNESYLESYNILIYTQLHNKSNILFIFKIRNRWIFLTNFSFCPQFGRRIRDSCRNLKGRQSQSSKSSCNIHSPEDYTSIQLPNVGSQQKEHSKLFLVLTEIQRSWLFNVSSNFPF